MSRPKKSLQINTCLVLKKVYRLILNPDINLQLKISPNFDLQK
jgi:hypothetical protein